MSTRKTSKARPKAINQGRQVSLTLKESIDLGRSLLAQEDLTSAEYVLGSILAALPEEPDALHLMGALRNMQGRSDEALGLMQRSIVLAPADAARWNDVGNVYSRLARRDEAMTAFSRCIELGPDTHTLASANHNLGRAYLGTNPVAAEASFRQSIQVSPEFALAWYGLSQALINQGRIPEGVDACGRAIVLMPKSASRELVARAYVHLGRTAEAIDHYQQWLKEEPDNPVLKHHLNALTQPDLPERASDAYVEAVFDDFASTFDSKLAQLQYHAPQLVAEALALVYPVANGALDIVDAGCGTGLCGPLVAPWARRLCGVDLSAGMLAQAAKRNTYGELHKSELVHFLDHHPGEFDVIVSADTLIYFANLTALMASFARATRVGGHIFCTVEALENASLNHELRTSGRYAHSLSHSAACANAAGLQIRATRSITLRIEAGRPAAGLLITLHHP